MGTDWTFCSAVRCVLVGGLAFGFLAIPSRARAATWQMAGYLHREIYRPSQESGSASYTGAYVMPDRSIMVSFYQQSGPRKQGVEAPPAVKKALLIWAGQYMSTLDSTGLDSRQIYLRSWDGGSTWKTWVEEPFRSAIGSAYDCGPETVLPDGTLLRGVWGHYLPYDAVPRTGYLQRSTDEGKTWGPPEVYLDPHRYTAWPKRLRVLRDGRLLCLGGISYAPAGSKTLDEYVKAGIEPILQVSSDRGHTWSAPLELVPAQARKGWVDFEECDAAELPNGDLLAMLRRGTIPADPNNAWDDKRSIWQSILAKSGQTWVPGAPVRMWPDSGHPDLLALKEGIVLYANMSRTASWADQPPQPCPGARWTDDAGKSWHDLAEVKTGYYPRSIQAADGTIHIFSHSNPDDSYGAEQVIMADSFRLRRKE